ncbi:hypothetical protein NQ317_002963 [Molorchus minor]|uniref:RNA-directed DNA polymerase n=1 Tax=Molorchus minor TaxID=1323400 RepID=A0ABQ9J209_9CUCU|nr:hypothetical protein NQ317_002963 [Molorchus minor]
MENAVFSDYFKQHEDCCYSIHMEVTFEVEKQEGTGKRLRKEFDFVHVYFIDNNYPFDVPIVGRFLEDQASFRKSLYYYFLMNDPPITRGGTNKVTSVLVTQSQMILEDTGLTTFKLSYSFVQQCDTEVHTLLPVVRQSMNILAAYDKITTESDANNHSAKYYYIFHSRLSELEISKYPDVAFCAIMKQKYYGSQSWANYEFSDLEMSLEYDFKIEHRKGRLHGNADAISRRPCAERCSHCKRAENKEFGSHCRRTAVVNDDNWETKKLCEEQQKDEDIKPFIAWKEEGTRPEWKDISNKSTTLKGYWAIWDSLIVEDGILKRLWENTDGKEIRKQIVLPRARVNEVLQEVHGGVGGGHFGVNKTLNKVRERFYWLRSRADVEDWCRRCAECASSKGPRTRSRGQMKQYNVRLDCSKNVLE